MKGAKLLQQHYPVINALENGISGVCSACGHRLSFFFWVLKILLHCHSVNEARETLLEVPWVLECLGFELQTKGACLTALPRH